ncbi:Methionyl-tRNA formyltransferase [Gracilaria domingensis]|nr:Methionyl-tRNA formyltransferase [Gracilaria domingensis]
MKRIPKLSSLSTRPSRCTITVSQSALIRVVFLGTPQITAIVLKKRYYASGSSQPTYEVNAVVTQPPSPQGVNRVLTKSPVHAFAEQIGLSPILTPLRASEQQFLEALSAIKPEVRISAAYGNFLPQQLSDVPKFGTLNIHLSLLPEFRGAAPVPRALEAGVQKTGVSVLYTVPKMDAGPVVAIEERPLTGDEQAPELLKELFDSGTVKMIEQDESRVSHAAKLSKEEARLSSTENAVLIHNKVHAFAGLPGTWADFILGDGDDAEPIRLKIGKTVALRREGGSSWIDRGATATEENDGGSKFWERAERAFVAKKAASVLIVKQVFFLLTDVPLPLITIPKCSVLPRQGILSVYFLIYTRSVNTTTIGRSTQLGADGGGGGTMSGGGGWMSPGGGGGRGAMSLGGGSGGGEIPIAAYDDSAVGKRLVEQMKAAQSRVGE